MSYDLWPLRSSAVNSDARNCETLSDVNRRSRDLCLLEARCDYVLFVDYGAINGDAVRLPSCPYVSIHRRCSLYAVPIDRRTTRGRFCWLNWFVWFSMHCLNTGVRHRLMRISNTVSWLMFDCHGGWLRQDAQRWQARGSDSGTLTGEKCWLVINKEYYLLKTVTEEWSKQRFSLYVKK